MANATDSVSIFSEGTFEEQISELVEFIARAHPEEERAAFIASWKATLTIAEGQKPLEEDEDKRRAIFGQFSQEIKSLGEGNDKEVEGFFNLLFAHLFSLFPHGSTQVTDFVNSLLQIISSAPSERSSTKYRILSNLFNALPVTSPLRFSVYSVILDLATRNDQLESLHLSLSKVAKWLSEWQISADEKALFLKNLIDTFNTVGQLTTAYEYTIAYVRTLPPTSPVAQSAAVDLIATALRLPGLFDLDPLFKLDAIIALRDHELFSLLQVFLSGGLSEFKTWKESHTDVAAKYNLSEADLEHKIRLLAFASLAFKNIGQNLPYSKIAEALQVDVSEVEKWSINVIRAGLVTGKLSQTTQSFYIVRSSVRTFEKAEWEVLEKRILAWKTGLQGVLEVINNAKRLAGHPGATAATAATATPVPAASA